MTPAKGPNKRAKGSGSIYYVEKRDKWYGAFDAPPRPGQTRNRRTVSVDGKGLTPRQAQAAVEAKIHDLRKQLEAEGDLPNPNQTVAQWFEVWWRFHSKDLRPKTRATYQSLIEQHIIPAIGSVRLRDLTAAHVRRVASAIEEKGLESSTALQAHRILSLAIKQAEAEGRISKNVVAQTKAPKKAHKELPVLSAAEAIQALTYARDQRLLSRWAAAFYTGARQGELLGLELDRVGDSLDLSWQLQRLPWEHGCGAPTGVESYKVRRKDGAEEPRTRLIYPCGNKLAGGCPQKRVDLPRSWEHRHLTGPVYLSRPKSKKGWRVIPLVTPLRELIERRMLEVERFQEPNPHGLLWTAEPTKRGERLTGAPIDYSDDNAAWHRLLEGAGVPRVRLHDARHTTASLLLLAGVPEPIIMKILGHSSYMVSRGYMHIDQQQVTEAMKALSALLPLAPAIPETR